MQAQPKQHVHPATIMTDTDVLMQDDSSLLGRPSLFTSNGLLSRNFVSTGLLSESLASEVGVNEEPESK